MSMLASLATINGDFAGYTYGLTPNNPSTWDAKKVKGQKNPHLRISSVL
jgi:hypothetical protein